MKRYKAALAEVAVLLARRGPHLQFMRQACELVVLHTSAAAAYVATIDPATEGVSVIVSAGPARDFVYASEINFGVDDPGGKGLAAQVYLANESLLFNDLKNAPEFSRHWDLIRKLGLGAAAGIRLKVGASSHAVLGLVATARDHFTHDIMTIAERMGDLLALAIEHDDERELRGRYTGFYAALAHLNDLVARDSEPQLLYEETCRLITTLSPELAAAVLTQKPHSERYQFVARSSNLVAKEDGDHLGSLWFSPDDARPEGRGFVGEVLRAGHSVLWNESVILESDRPVSQLLHQAGSRALLGSPIFVGSEPAAVLVLSANRAGYFTEEMRQLAERIAVNLGHGVHSHGQRLALERQAFVDALTGLANRTLLMKRLETAVDRAARDGTRIALALLDIDGLKDINDQFGHSVGDAVIGTIAQRLHERFPDADLVARVAGDEFGGVFSPWGGDEPLEIPAARFLKAVSEPISVDDLHFNVTAGLGFALYPHDARSAQDLMRRADLALHEAKSRGRSCWSRFQTGAETELVRRRHIREQFQQGIDDGKVLFHYQPKVDMRTGAVWGAEALVRWHEGQHEYLAPGEWLPIIEAEAGLSATLGRHALASVVEQLVRWHEKGLKLSISVNISARHLQMPVFLRDVRSALSKRPELAPYLSLEVTETALVEDAERLSDVLAACRRMGLRVELDDFGTGHASLAYLQRLPADVVKIDVDFVLSMPWETRAFSIVAGTLQMSQLLGLGVVAEGVETEEHGRRLLQLGSPLAQGFAISPPLPAEDFERWLRTWRPPDSWLKEQPVATIPLSYRLLGALVYHRGQRRRVFESEGAGLKDTEGWQSSCPLRIAEDLSKATESLHANLHRLEGVAIQMLERCSRAPVSDRDEWLECLTRFEQMIDKELS